MIRECRTCGRIYKTQGWFKKHVKNHQHNPIPFVYERSTDLKKEITSLKHEVSELKGMIQKLLLRKPQEPIIRKKTVTTTTEYKYTRGSHNDYSQCMNELKQRLASNNFELAPVGT